MVRSFGETTSNPDHFNRSWARHRHALTPPPLCGMSVWHSETVANRRVSACMEGDLTSAVAAVADGACVNVRGRGSSWLVSGPLFAAVFGQHVDVATWLLSQGGH